MEISNQNATQVINYSVATDLFPACSTSIYEDGSVKVYGDVKGDCPRFKYLDELKTKDLTRRLFEAVKKLPLNTIGLSGACISTHYEINWQGQIIKFNHTEEDVGKLTCEFVGLERELDSIWHAVKTEQDRRMEEEWNLHPEKRVRVYYTDED